MNNSLMYNLVESGLNSLLNYQSYFQNYIILTKMLLMQIQPVTIPGKSMNVSENWLFNHSSLASQVHAAAVNGDKSTLQKLIAGKCFLYKSVS